ncbi:MAG: hypothetical protein M1829_004242 [Trizodia sp. TS-e1964]|nr:MAG: hypothetical protein M1829_004242 [Trizodia sp. TS-e1964]
MSTLNEMPWHEAEKLFLLAEILKDARIPTDMLLALVVDAKIEPNWDAIPLPPGRSLNSCKNAFHQLFPAPSHAMQTPHSPSHGPAQHHYGGQRASKPRGSPNPRKRPLPGPEIQTPTAAPPNTRVIQPRPSFPSLNGDPENPLQASPLDADGNPPPKKKRGRPTKAEAEAKAAAAQARGEAYPPAKAPRKSSGAAGNPLGGNDALLNAHLSDPSSLPLPPPSTPVATAPLEPDSTSASKKRRGRPTKEESLVKKLLSENAASAVGDRGTLVESDDVDALHDDSMSDRGESGLEKLLKGAIHEAELIQSNEKEITMVHHDAGGLHHHHHHHHMGPEDPL